MQTDPVNEPSEETILAEIEALIRAPGEVFGEEWDFYSPRHPGPDVSTIWFQEPGGVNEVWLLTDAMARAWDDLLHEHPPFRQWFLTHRAALTPPSDAGTFLQVNDAGSEKFTRGRTGNLTLHTPVAPLRKSDLPEVEFRRLLVRLVSRRAALTGLAPPPPLES